MEWFWGTTPGCESKYHFWRMVSRLTSRRLGWIYKVTVPAGAKRRNHNFAASEQPANEGKSSRP